MNGKKKVRNEKRQFERYWPPGCIYANWPNYWAYRDLNPWHGWACPYDNRECPGRTVQVRRCQEDISEAKKLAGAKGDLRWPD